MKARTIPAMLAVSIAALALGGCPKAESSPKLRAPAATALGEPVNCISRTRIQDMHVHDDYTIDFEMAGSEVFRTTLPNRCPGLGFDERIAYETSLDRLCSTDNFTVIQTNGGLGATCGFGMFTPVRIDK
jgi:hypothetical protein